jgi:pyridoxine kinase
MGDDNRLYVHPDIPAVFTAALPHADLLTPNQFELGLLSAQPGATLPNIRDAALALRARLRSAGPRAVLVTSLITPQTPATEIHALLAAEAGAFLIKTQRLPAKFHGAGDTLAALFLFHTLALGDPVRAAQCAISSLAGLLHRTFEAGSAELLTVAAQEEFVNPSVRAEIVAI